jgi:prepilin-type N-terminal cleavage/methylation domain-containing protein
MLIEKKQKIKGLTLIETLVAIAIFAIGMVGFSILLVNVWRNNSYTLEMGQSNLVISQGISKMVGYIRKARQGDDGSYPIKSAGNNDLVVYSDYNRDGITERLHFYYASGAVFMGVTAPSGNMPKVYPAGDQQIIVIATKIVNASNEPIFYYFNKNYPGDTANNPLLMPVDVSVVRLVEIHLKININPNRAPDNIEMQSFAEIRNLNDYDHIQ